MDKREEGVQAARIYLAVQPEWGVCHWHGEHRKRPMFLRGEGRRAFGYCRLSFRHPLETVMCWCQKGSWISTSGVRRWGLDWQFGSQKHLDSNLRVGHGWACQGQAWSEKGKGLSKRHLRLHSANADSWWPPSSACSAPSGSLAAPFSRPLSMETGAIRSPFCVSLSTSSLFSNPKFKMYQESIPSLHVRCCQMDGNPSYLSFRLAKSFSSDFPAPPLVPLQGLYATYSPYILLPAALSPRYSQSPRPLHLLQAFVRMSPSQWSLPWPLCLKMNLPAGWHTVSFLFCLIFLHSICNF